MGASSDLATRVPALWTGATVAILGGGPSLTTAQVAQVAAARKAGRCRVVAINNAYGLAPWADLLWFCDERWFQAHRGAVLAFAGIVATLENYGLRAQRPDLWCLHNMGRDGFFAEPFGLMHGRNSGYQVLHLQAHLGAARVLLLGYDMKVSAGRTHWHAGHAQAVDPGDYARLMLPCFAGLVEPLRRRGVAVVNCTPGSALEVFPRQSLCAALG